jgi:hypothetical protein
MFLSFCVCALCWAEIAVLSLNCYPGGKALHPNEKIGVVLSRDGHHVIVAVPNALRGLDGGV